MVGWFFTTPGDFLDDPDSLASDYADDLGMFLGGAQMAAIAAAALLWFSGTIASALIANGAGERLAGMARSGGSAAAALLMSGVAIIAVGALIVGRAGRDRGRKREPSVQCGRRPRVRGDAARGCGAVRGNRIGSLRGNRFLPYWLDWASLVLVVALLILFINWIAVMLLFPVWVTLTPSAAITSLMNWLGSNSVGWSRD